MGEKNRMTEKKLKKYNEIWIKIKEKINCKVKKNLKSGRDQCST